MEFVEPIQRQEIVDLLAIHVGSGGSAVALPIGIVNNGDHFGRPSTIVDS